MLVGVTPDGMAVTVAALPPEAPYESPPCANMPTMLPVVVAGVPTVIPPPVFVKATAPPLPPFVAEPVNCAWPPRLTTPNARSRLVPAALTETAPPSPAVWPLAAATSKPRETMLTVCELSWLPLPVVTSCSPLPMETAPAELM